MPAASAADGPLWEIEGLAVSAGTHEILAPLTLSLSRGRVHGLIGPNGSGKSTLLKVLAGQLTPRAGEVRLEGQPLAHWRGRAFARKVAYMPQFTPLAEGLTVRELVGLGRYPWHGALGRFGANDEARVEAALRRAGLTAMAGRLVDSLSGGERQRAWLAVMLAQEAQCLLLDEPTSALDIAHQMEVLSIVRDLAAEGEALAVIVVLHDINLAARTCDDLVALRAGRLVAQGPCAEIVTPQILEAIYGVPMGVLPHPVNGAPMGYVL